MRTKFNFWAASVTPWTGENRLFLSLYLSVLTGLIIVITFITNGKISLHVMWIYLVPVAFYVLNWIVGSLVNRLKQKLPPNHLLQTDCIIVKNILQTPGIAHLEDKKLILQPLIGKAISIPLENLKQFRERRWYNGQGYWGQTIFFELSVLNEWRIGFGVAKAALWRDALNKCK